MRALRRRHAIGCRCAMQCSCGWGASVYVCVRRRLVLRVGVAVGTVRLDGLVSGAVACAGPRVQSTGMRKRNCSSSKANDRTSGVGRGTLFLFSPLVFFPRTESDKPWRWRSGLTLLHFGGFVF